MNDEWDIYMKHALWDSGLDGPKSAEHGDIMNTVRRLISEARAAETARADAAEKLATRYREALFGIICEAGQMRVNEVWTPIYAVERALILAQQALASAPGDVSIKGDSLDMTSDGSKGER